MIRYIEFGFVPLVKSARPGETLFIDTQLSWADGGMGHQTSEDSLRMRVTRLLSRIRSALSLPAGSGVEGVIIRARGEENTAGIGISYAVKKSMSRVLQSVALHLAKKHRCRLAVIDRRDETSIHPNDRKLLWRCDLYFKRELPWATWAAFDCLKPARISIGATSRQPLTVRWAGKLRPLPLGIEDRLIESEPPAAGEILYDVFYSGASHGLERRVHVERELGKLAAAGIKVKIPENRLSRDEFLKVIRQSRIGISPGGVGWDCFRHYEIPAAGAALMIEQPCHQIHKPPGNGVEAIHYAPGESLSRLVESWLHRRDDLQRIAAAGNKWARNHQSHSALGEKVVSQLSALG
jgi:hypothetical protein